MDEASGMGSIRVPLGVEFGDHKPDELAAGDKYTQRLQRLAEAQTVIVRDIRHRKVVIVYHIYIQVDENVLCLVFEPGESLPSHLLSPPSDLSNGVFTHRTAFQAQ